MKKTCHRFLSLFLVLVLALGLTMPALAADVPVTGVSLDQTAVTLVPGNTVQLKATVQPSDATNAAVTWSSNKTNVATVSSDGLVKAVAQGTADITVTTKDGDYRAVCTVTVENDYVSAVTISPSGPETLPVGKQRQLTATVTYAHGTKGDQTVTWTTSDPKVATVSPDGLVTAVAEGQAEILALSNGKNQSGTSVMAAYRLTVTKESETDATDSLQLSSSLVETSGGQFVDTVLTAPKAVVYDSEKQDVTDAYNLSYRWADSSGKELGTAATQTIQPISLTSMVLTCTVTAVSKTDSSQTLSGTCRYQVKVYPGTTVGAVLNVSDGATSLKNLKDLEGKLSVLDQLLKGDEDLGIAQPIPGLTSVVFDLSTVTGQEAGTLSVQADTPYYLEESQQEARELLENVTFTPKAKGTYAINFLAYGDLTYYGRLEIVVDGQAEIPPTESDKTCDATGFTFAGSDFYHSGDADPVVSVVFQQPASGKLVRNLAYGSGTEDTGSRYYTNAASDGDYHVSTLSYLPHAGFSGQAVLTMTLTTQSGQTRTETLTVNVTSKTHSDHFTDVTEDTVGLWAANAVDYAYHFGLVGGVSEDKFAPNTSMTRAQLVTILYRAAGSPQMTVTTNFEDLDVGAYYYSAVVWATVTGVVNGTSDTTFSPNSYVTREQIAAILYRYADTMGDNVTVSGNLNAYTDKDQVSDYAVEPMLWAVDRGIISGTTDTTLSPKSTATRAQVVVMLHRYLTD